MLLKDFDQCSVPLHLFLKIYTYWPLEEKRKKNTKLLIHCRKRDEVRFSVILFLGLYLISLRIQKKLTFDQYLLIPLFM